MIGASVTNTALAALRPLVEPPLAGQAVRGGRLPEALETRYGGELAIPLRGDRPTIVANFVSTLDGVVSYNTPQAAGGGEISGFFEPDRFVMGLLRSLADVVLIGAGTLRAAPADRWTAEFIHPDSAAAFGSLRTALGLRRHPLTAVVTGSGKLDFEHPGLADPAVDVLVITTDAEADALAGRAPRHVEVQGVGERVDTDGLVRALASRGADLVLCEGGPHLLGQLVDANVVDELFLTIAPQLAGRSDDMPRLQLVEGVAFDVARGSWARLVDLRRVDDHLFTRYRFT